MDLKKLEYLESVYRLQSFSKAASEHYISQPSISNAIHRLEEELGVTLIDRDSKPLVLTMDGLRFMPHVYKILNSVSAAEHEILEIAARNKGKISLVVHSTIGDWIVSRMAYDFHQVYPQYYAVMGEDSIEGTLYNLSHDKVDAAYTLIPPNLDQSLFDAIPIIHCSLQVMMANDHPLTKKEVVSFEDIKDETIFTFPEGSQLMSTLMQWFQENGGTPKIMTPGSVHVIAELVAQNCGIFFATVDSLSTLKDSPCYQVRPLDHEFRYSKGFIVKKGAAGRRPISTLISFVEDAVRERYTKESITGPIFFPV